MRQITIHFIRRDMMKTKRSLTLRRQLTPVGSRRLKQHIGAYNVGLNKLAGAINGAVYVTFCRKMHDRIRLMHCKHPLHLGGITDIHLFEHIARAVADARQRLKIAGIGQLVEVDNRMSSIVDQVTNHSTANKTGTAGNQNFHEFFLLIPAPTAGFKIEYHRANLFRRILPSLQSGPANYELTCSCSPSKHRPSDCLQWGIGADNSCLILALLSTL